MVLEPSKLRVFEEHEIPTEGGNVLHARMMFPKPPQFPKRLVFIPPLVGASASQPLIIFRNLTRRGCILLSFEYRGHPRSTGTFELDKTIVDTRHALIWATNYARKHGLPLHGFTTCYGAIALAAQFADPKRKCPLWSFNTISGLFRLDQILRFEDFASILSGYVGAKLDAAALLKAVAQRAIDSGGDAFRQALYTYLTGLFPELRIGRDHFEELQYDRADIPGTLLQLSRARYLEGLSIPPEVPSNIFFGWNDDVLSLQTRKGREAYSNHVLSLIPHAEIEGWEIDHFGRGPGHDPVIERLADKLEECEAHTVFPVQMDVGLPLQDVPK